MYIGLGLHKGPATQDHGDYDWHSENSKHLLRRSLGFIPHTRLYCQVLSVVSNRNSYRHLQKREGTSYSKDRVAGTIRNHNETQELLRKGQCTHPDFLRSGPERTQDGDTPGYRLAHHPLSHTFMPSPPLWYAAFQWVSSLTTAAVSNPSPPLHSLCVLFPTSYLLLLIIPTDLWLPVAPVTLWSQISCFLSVSL